MGYYDTHTHCLHSFDSNAEIDDMINAAINAGLSGICFTDHHDIDFPKTDPADPDALLDIPRHLYEIADSKLRFKDNIEVYCGIEIGLQPHVAAQNTDIIQNHDFDFVIGSCHVLNGEDPYYGGVYKGRDESEVHREYFESVMENITAFHDFDVFGHLDYIVRYGPNKDLEYNYEKHADIIDDILRKLISMDKGIEVNTSGLKSGLKYPNPCFDIIRRYRELGGDIITTGSDAHEPSTVGYEFGILSDMLRSAGFDHFNIFKNRTPFSIPLN